MDNLTVWVLITVWFCMGVFIGINLRGSKDWKGNP